MVQIDWRNQKRTRRMSSVSVEASLILDCFVHRTRVSWEPRNSCFPRHWNGFVPLSPTAFSVDVTDAGVKFVFRKNFVHLCPNPRQDLPPGTEHESGNNSHVNKPCHVSRREAEFHLSTPWIPACFLVQQLATKSHSAGWKMRCLSRRRAPNGTRLNS